MILSTQNISPLSCKRWGFYYSKTRRENTLIFRLFDSQKLPSKTSISQYEKTAPKSDPLLLINEEIYYLLFFLIAINNPKDKAVIDAATTIIIVELVDSSTGLIGLIIEEAGS